MTAKGKNPLGEEKGHNAVAINLQPRVTPHQTMVMKTILRMVVGLTVAMTAIVKEEMVVELWQKVEQRLNSRFSW
jgi:hypothetical protein